MSEEVNNDGTWSGMKKTIIGTLTTVITGGGVWLSTMLFGGHSEEPKEEAREVFFRLGDELNVPLGVQK